MSGYISVITFPVNPSVQYIVCQKFLAIQADTEARSKPQRGL